MLTTCKDCKREMSTSANKCPYCGAVPLLRQVINGIVFAVIVLVLIRIFA